MGPLGGLRKRWQQLRSAGRFLRGTGLVPQIPGFEGEAMFDAVDAAGAATDGADEINDLLRRYLTARLQSRSVFGEGYYGRPVFVGLNALCLSVAAASWLARFKAALDDRGCLCCSDMALALGIVDRAATRLPSLGTAAERARAAYLSKDDGIARLLHEYDPTGRQEKA